MPILTIFIRCGARFSAPAADNAELDMRIALSLLLLIVTSIAAMPASTSRTDMSESRGLLETPQRIQQAWLRFHETELCMEVDAVFVFRKDGMEVWCRSENVRNYQKLRELLEPLRDSYRIDVYSTPPGKAEESNEKWDPPASLWENYELRSYLGDPFARARERRGPDLIANMDFPPADEVLKQRLLVYAEQILEWDIQMKRYAMHLPALTQLALDPLTTSRLRAAAATIGKIHAQKLEKILQKMEKSLKHAFPNHDRKKNPLSGEEESGREDKTPLDFAMRIATESQDLSSRIKSFFYPMHFAIDLNELRQPRLLGDLDRLEEMVSNYQKMLIKSSHR